MSLRLNQVSVKAGSRGKAWVDTMVRRPRDQAMEDRAIRDEGQRENMIKYRYDHV